MEKANLVLESGPKNSKRIVGFGRSVALHFCSPSARWQMPDARSDSAPLEISEVAVRPSPGITAATLAPIRALQRPSRRAAGVAPGRRALGKQQRLG
jgi:hypothetical protein